LKTLDVSFLHLLDYTYVFFIRLAHLNLACTSCDVSIARYPNSRLHPPQSPSSKYSRKAVFVLIAVHSQFAPRREFEVGEVPDGSVTVPSCMIAVGRMSVERLTPSLALSRTLSSRDGSAVDQNLGK
jgi:hypothetical protein